MRSARWPDYIDQIGRYFLADVNVTLKQPYRVDEIERLIKAVPGVSASKPGRPRLAS